MTGSIRPSITNGTVKAVGGYGGGGLLAAAVVYLLTQMGAVDTKNATQDVKIERTQDDVKEMKGDIKQILQIVRNQRHYPKPVRPGAE